MLAEMLLAEKRFFPEPTFT